MFKFEKDMIPVLKKCLSEKYQTAYFIDEFNSGNGIADLVFTTEKINNNKRYILDYELIHIVFKYFNRKNKKIEVKKLFKDTFLTKKQTYGLIKYLLENDILEPIDKENFYVKKKYSPPIKKIISIEAKLFDWKGGFYQALRYKAYSHKSYLAISEEFAHRVDRDLLKEHNIGLIIVSPEKIDFSINIINEKPSNIVAHAYLSEKMANIMFV
jgi:hypothetical protein